MNQGEQAMQLPNGLTCSDCQHFSGKCSKMFGAEPGNTTCDWSPHRFLRDRAKIEAENAELRQALKVLGASARDIVEQPARVARLVEDLDAPPTECRDCGVGLPLDADIDICMACWDDKWSDR